MSPINSNQWHVGLIHYGEREVAKEFACSTDRRTKADRILAQLKSGTT